MSDVRRDLLVEQLEIMWRFALEHVLDRLDRAACLWEPSANVCTVRSVDGRWCADWPDESRTPLAEPTAGWLLWHLEWWWTQTLRSTDDLHQVVVRRDNARGRDDLGDGVVPAPGAGGAL